jgi:hypothetical protein
LSSNRSSEQFSDDSRFRSAEESPQDDLVSPQSTADGLQLNDDDFYEEYHHESMVSFRDSNGNSIRYDINESPEVGQAVEQPGLFTPFASYSHGSSLNTQAINVQERYMRGPERRPTSVDKVAKKRSSFSASHFEGVPENEVDDSKEVAFL